jgi:hypothetical protein
MELIELPTHAVTHNTAGGSMGSMEKAAAMQNGEEGGGGDRQAVTGLKKKGALWSLVNAWFGCLIFCMHAGLSSCLTGF